MLKQNIQTSSRRKRTCRAKVMALLGPSPDETKKNLDSTSAWFLPHLGWFVGKISMGVINPELTGFGF